MPAEAVRSTRQNLGDFLYRQCEYYQELTALKFQRDNREVNITYKKMHSLARELAGGLLKEGIRSGDIVCILADNSAEWVLAFLAIQYAGAIDACFEDSGDTRGNLDILERVGASLVFAAREPSLVALGKHTDLPLIHLSWTMPGALPNNLRSLYHLRKKGQGMPGLGARLDFQRAQCLAEDPASILFKQPLESRGLLGVVQSHAGILKNIEQFSSIVPAGETDRILNSNPLWHTSGRLALYFAFNNAAALIISSADRFQIDLKQTNPSLIFAAPRSLVQFHQRVRNGKPGESLARIMLRRFYLRLCRLWNRANGFIFEEKRDTRTESDPLILPTMLFTLLMWILMGPVKLLGDYVFKREIQNRLGNSLRAILTGGARLAWQLDDFFRTMNVPILEGYWLTEAGHIVACRSLEFTGQRSRLTVGTVGAVLPGIGLKLINQWGEDITTRIGEVGQIYIRGDNTMVGYLGRPGLTAEVIDANGWLRTGDRGLLFESGDLQIMPRQSRLDDFSERDLD